MELWWIPQYESKLASYLMTLSLNPMPPGADPPTSLYEGKNGGGSRTRSNHLSDFDLYCASHSGAWLSANLHVTMVYIKYTLPETKIAPARKPS